MPSSGRAHHGLISACVALCALVALGPSAVAAQADTRYVATTGSDAGNDCLTQAAPCQTIQHAIGAAAPADTVEVAAGIYAENLIIGKAVSLRGPNAGIDPNTKSRAPEATIDGGGLTAVQPEVPGISVDGFRILGTDEGFPVYTVGSDVTGLTVSNNILSTGVRALTIATSGNDLRILDNDIDGAIYGIHFGAGTFEDVRINGNVVEPATTNGIFINGEGSIDEFVMTENTIRGNSNIAADITEGIVTDNAFDVDRPGSRNLQISLHDSVLTENSFNGNGTTSCLQIFGSQFGLVPSKDLEVSGNTFEECNVYGIQLSPDIEEIEITGNTITGARQGINTRNVEGEVWDPTGKEISLVANRIVGSTEAGIVNTVEGTLDARNNWWGCNGGPGTTGCAPSVGGVETTPHLVLSGEAAAEIGPGATAQVTGRLDRNSAGDAIHGVPDGPTVDFASALGSFSPSSSALVGGTASSIFTAGSQTGPAGVQIELDGEVVGLPLTVAAPLTQPPPPSATTPRSEKPEIEVANDGDEKVVSRAGRFEIATVGCPVEGCAIRTPMHRVKIAGKLFNVRAGTRRWIVASESTSVRLLLTRAARRAFLAAGRGRASIAVVVTTVDDITEAKTVEIEVELETRPDEDA